MKKTLSYLTLIALSTLISAQIPGCATKCIADAVAYSTTCEATDFACQCTSSNLELIKSTSAACVITSCGGVQQALDVLAAAQAACDGRLKASFSSATSKAFATNATASSASTSSAAATTTEASELAFDPNAAVPTVMATGGTTTTTVPIVVCGCVESPPGSPPCAVPSPTASRNGTLTTAAPPVAFTGEATLATISLGAGLAWLAILGVLAGF